jgi:hypothetical protein
MLPSEFVFWLWGYFEISDSNNLSPQQVQIIRDHLALVFEKVTPDRNTPVILPEIDLQDGANKPIIDWENFRKMCKPKEETRYC